ncbi:MAG TPA: hypothetical protein VJU61_02625 [Polyangiaceae bacterium]|nr:hypothetical protein [Polyangiaceae bacterium]
MKNHLITVLTVLTLGFNAACAGSPAAPANSGIDVRLNAGADTSAPRPEGVLRVQGIDNGVSAYVPVAPLDPGSNTQRVALPPGSYSVSYSPVVLEGSLGSLRNRAAAKILSANPFLIEVGDGQFLPIDVRAATGAPTAATGRARLPVATR